MEKPATKPREIGSDSLAYVEQLHLQFLRDPSGVSPSWRRYFEQLPGDEPFQAKPRLRPSFRPGSLFDRVNGNGHGAPAQGAPERIAPLLDAFRRWGHLAADLDPLERPRPRPRELDPAFHGFTEADMDRAFPLRIGRATRPLPLRRIVERMRRTYCRCIGAEFMHIADPEAREWLRERMEETENRTELSEEQRFLILRRLIEAVVFEEFTLKKYLGAKTFSLEGAETLIPLLDFALEKAGAMGAEEVVLAMAHRGRLNVLSNILGKPPRLIFREFEDTDPERYRSSGDVKYHLGYTNKWTTQEGRTLGLALCFNPSHLEFVNPVALGRARAKQDRLGDRERKRCKTILIHGDAAFAGEGVVQESLNLSRLDAYEAGGSLHVIINNQLGFTTSPEEGRSGAYASDAARALDIPVFHVNGEDPEALIHATGLAMDFCHAFGRDAVIDMYCFRRWGHNESDEPSFTQPLMYRRIEERDPPLELHAKRLCERWGVDRASVDEIVEARKARLDEEYAIARREHAPLQEEIEDEVWRGYHGGPASGAREVDTTVPEERLRELLEKQTHLPDDFHPHRKIGRSIARRRKMLEGGAPIDWSAAEALAFATLATEGVRIRLTGQDSARGTFSHRHAALHDTEDGRVYVPLQHLEEGQAPVEIRNSPLSETGVLGFEYGYSLDCPDGLVLWEAQFGDFCNAAQVIIDQFIVSGEDKWKNLSGLVLLLPHGFEGSGPEHSSARLERFLLLAAEDNIQVVCPTTPAQYYHCLRRQALRRWRKPLIVMTPKSLLRDPRSTASFEELARGRFEKIIADRGESREPPKRILLCSGKVYFDLAEKREELGRTDVAILRIEELYPLPDEAMHAALAPYPDGTPAVWVQEEPENMGAWRYLRARFGEHLLGRLPFGAVCRPESASPASGSSASHKLEQKELIERAFADAVG